MNCWDLIVVGAGPAGLTSGIYSASNNLKTLILEEKTPGGEAAEIPLIEDFPGFPDGIRGCELVNKMTEQCKKSGTEIHELEKVVQLELKGDPKTVKTDKSEYIAKAIIIASGCHPKMLQVPGENEFRGRGVSYCAVCDGTFFKDKKIIVIGDGSQAASVAKYLSKLASTVMLAHQGNRLRAEEMLVSSLQKQKVEILSNIELKEIKGDFRVRNVILVNTKTNETRNIEVDGVFFQLNGVPNSQLAERAGVKVDLDGYIIVDELQRTNIKGVYAAGDVTTCPVKKVATAAGKATIAVNETSRYVKRSKDGEKV